MFCIMRVKLAIATLAIKCIGMNLRQLVKVISIFDVAEKDFVKIASKCSGLHAYECYTSLCITQTHDNLSMKMCMDNLWSPYTVGALFKLTCTVRRSLMKLFFLLLSTRQSTWQFLYPCFKMWLANFLEFLYQSVTYCNQLFVQESLTKSYQ